MIYYFLFFLLLKFKEYIALPFPWSEKPKRLCGTLIALTTLNSSITTQESLILLVCFHLIFSHVAKQMRLTCEKCLKSGEHIPINNGEENKNDCRIHLLNVALQITP